MLSRYVGRIGNILPKVLMPVRHRHTSRKPLKVCVVGAAGGVGRHLSMLLKLHPEVITLALHDLKSDVMGVAADISDIDADAIVTGYCGEDSLVEAVACSEIVVVVAGHHHKEGVEEHHKLLVCNGPIIEEIMKAIVKGNCKTRPFIHIVTNPVNALVPLAARVLESMDSYDERKLSGSTAIDSMRARAFLGKHVSSDPEKITVPVVGGHSPDSITPIISQSMPDFDLTNETKCDIMQRVIMGYKEVFEASKKESTAQQSVAYAVARFCYSLIDAIRGKKVNETAYIPTKENKKVQFLAQSFSLNDEGVDKIFKLPKMDESEEEQFECAIEDINKNIEMANAMMDKKANKK